MNASGGRVVVGVGESLAALQALRYATEEARRREATLRAVRVSDWAVGWRGHDAGVIRAELQQSAQADIVWAFDQAMGGLPPGLRLELAWPWGAVAPTLVAQTTSADLLVVGASRHRWGRPGGVDTRCLRLAPCPVIVVPEPELARRYRTRALTRAITREAQRYAELGG